MMAKRTRGTGGEASRRQGLVEDGSATVPAAAPRDTDASWRSADAGDREEKTDQILFPPVREGTIGGRSQLTVDTRDLHVTLRVKTKERVWIRRRLKQLGLEDGTDFEARSGVGDRRGVILPKVGINSRGRPNDVHVLTIEAANHVAMAERTPVGHAIRRYFIACETRLREIASSVADAETERLRAEVARLSGGAKRDRDAPLGGPRREDGAPGGREAMVALVRDLAALPGADATFVAETLRVIASDDEETSPTVEPTHARPAGGRASGQPDPGVRKPASASATPGGANAEADGRPDNLHRTRVGIVIDLRLPIKGSADADRLAVCTAFGTRPFDARTIKVWKTAFDRMGAGRGTPGRTTPRGVGADPSKNHTGTTMETRRAMAEAYDAVRAERAVATPAFRTAERDAALRDAVAARWAKVRNELN